VEANPPRHAWLRKLVAKALSPQAVATYEERIREHVIELIERLAARGACDLVPEFAFPVPAKMMFHPPLLGHPLPVEGDWIAVFQGWVHDLKTNPAKSAQAGKMILAYLERLLADRDAHPQDDIPSELLEVVRSGGDLNRQEALGIMFVLFMGGIETPANAIGLLLLHFAHHPEDVERLRANPDEIPSAIEELLRFYGPSQGVRRTLTEDVCLHGQTLSKGEPVWLLLNGADRDELEFEHAQEIRFDRHPNRHLGFGAGPHRCIGSHLARLLLRVITQELVDRAPRFRLQDGAQLRWGMGVSRSLETLPVVFERP
jgi:cytochrome P450